MAMTYKGPLERVEIEPSVVRIHDGPREWSVAQELRRQGAKFWDIELVDSSDCHLTGRKRIYFRKIHKMNPLDPPLGYDELNVQLPLGPSESP